MTAAGHAGGHRRAGRGGRIARASLQARGFALIGVVGVLALLSLLAAWSLAAAPMAALRDASREAMAVEARSAAESGLAMALHRLNAPQALDARCEPDPEPGAPHWLALHLDPNPEGGRLLVDASAAAPSATSSPSRPWTVMACRASHSPPSRPEASLPAATWQCRCQVAGVGQPSGDMPQPGGSGAVQAGFAIGWRSVPDGSGRFVTRLESSGCVRADADCLRPPQSGEAPAVRRSVDLEAWPLLARWPAAALTAGGPIRLGPQSLIRNADPSSGGRVLHAGGPIERQGASLQGLPGAPASDLGIQRDASLAGLGPDELHLSILGLPAATWQALPQIGRVACPAAGGSCAQQVAQRQAEGRLAMAVDGDLILPPGFELGRPDQPVLLVVRGALQVQGPARIVGLAVADRLTLDGRSGAVQWQGAAVTAGAIEAMGSVQATREAGALDALARRPAAVLPRAGSWREGGATDGAAAGAIP